ncbi:MAG: hypothetical protein LBQ64_04685 [Bacteroidales bacterium]|jgi:hypothetical protein|nr:hypothetical protein [Bacteroidales bacterium]
MTSCIFCFVSCKKEPQKGEYKGNFEGQVNNRTYKTAYYFDVTHSSKKELHLREKTSQVTSVLKKGKNNSISGMIGFGKVLEKDAFNTITIQGTYDKKSITGTFSTLFTDGTTTYPSEGTFTLEWY